MGLQAFLDETEIENESYLREKLEFRHKELLAVIEASKF